MATDPADITGDEVALQAARTLRRVGPEVGHELANRLGAVRAFGAVLRLDEHAVTEYGLETIDAVRDAGDGALQLSQSILRLVSDRPPVRVPVRLADAVAAVLALAAPGARAPLRLDVDIPDDLAAAEADPARLHQALAAVVVNALDALGHPRAAGRLVVTGREVGAGGARAVELRVTDDAPPVPDADAAHLFDPRPPAGCSPRAGLDLAVARHLLGLDGGSLRYERGADGTNVLVLALAPVATAERSAGGGPAGGPAAGSRPVAPCTVLVCDDSAPVRELLVRLLDREGIRALPARSGAEALSILGEHDVDVVLADNRMAGMHGPDLHAAVTTRRPSLRRRFVLVSGDPEDTELVTFARREGLRVLPKPFEASAVLAAIREAAAG